MLKLKRNKRGQSTLEYITVFVAIVAAIVMVVWNLLNPAMNNVMTSAAGKIDDAAATFGSATIE